MAVTLLVGGESSAIYQCHPFTFNLGWSTNTATPRFVSPDIAKKYDLQVPEYAGVDQVVEIENNGQKL